MPELPPEIKNAIALEPGEAVIKAWHGWYMDGKYLPYSVEDSLREGYIILTTSGVLFLHVLRGAFGKILSVRPGFHVIFDGTNSVGSEGDTLGIDKLRFRIKNVNMQDVVGSIEKVVMSRGGGVRPAPQTSLFIDVSSGQQDRPLPSAETGSPSGSGSGQLITCPDCHELTGSDKRRCEKCGADISWIQ